MEILGAVLDTAQRRIQLVLPQQSISLRSPCAVSSARCSTQGLTTRIYLVCRLSWPKDTIIAQVKTLLRLYRKRGFFGALPGSGFEERSPKVQHQMAAGSMRPDLLCYTHFPSFFASHRVSLSRPFVRVRAPVVPAAVLFNVASSLYCHDATLTFSRIMDGRVDPDTCGPAEQLRRSRNFGPGANFRNGT